MTKPFSIFLLALCFIAFTNTDCKKNPVAPPPPISNDTTSNNLTFQTFVFGGNAGSCVFNDVAIISDTDIWAVGAVYLDSANGNPDPFPYNAAHWNGKTWNLQKIPYDYQGQLFFSPLKTVFAFSGNDIWFAGQIHWNGQAFNPIELPSSVWGSYNVNKMWGTSDANFYIVGDGGSMAHFNGSSWTQITSGTSLTFNDIYGSGGQILAVCIQFSPLGGEIFSIQGNTATEISSSPIDGCQLYGVWFVPNKYYYIALEYGGVYEKETLTDNSWNPLAITGSSTTGVRGNGVNDVFVVSATGDLIHWNGVSWQSFRGQTGLSGGGYARVAVNGNTVVAVGANSPQAIITMGKRQ
jgi:hypothetical protein